MIDRIKSLFLGGGAAASPAAADHHDEIQLAAAALLVEAAYQDETFDDDERAHVAEVVRRRFGLTAEEAATLIGAAEREVRERVQILPFTRVLKDRFTPEERIEMVEMLWEVVYVDGALHDHEATLMRRIGGLVYVPDRERGAARKRALRKLKAASRPEERK